MIKIESIRIRGKTLTIKYVKNMRRIMGLYGRLNWDDATIEVQDDSKWISHLIHEILHTGFEDLEPVKIEETVVERQEMAIMLLLKKVGLI